MTRTKLTHSGPLIILMFCTVAFVAWKRVRRTGRTMESSFALEYGDAMLNQQSHQQHEQNLQLVVPRLAGPVKSSSTVEEDVLAAQQPEGSLILEVKCERIVGPVV